MWYNVDIIMKEVVFMCIAPILSVHLPIADCITNELSKLGMSNNTKGYHFAFYAIKLYITKPEIFNSLTKSVYPTIADEFSTTPQAVERLMRYSIENTFEYGDIDEIYGLFGDSISENKGKVTNGCFIKTIANMIINKNR